MVDEKKMGDREFKGDKVSQAYRAAGKEQARHIGAMAEASMAPAYAAGNYVKDIYNKGFMNATGGAYRGAIDKTTDAMEGIGGFLSKSGSQISDATGAAIDTAAATTDFVGEQAGIAAGNVVDATSSATKNFQEGAGITPEPPAPPAEETERLTAEQAAANENIEQAPVVPGEEPLPAGISELTLQDGSTAYKNTELTPEEQKKYGKAIYGDSAEVVTPEGFDAQGGISTIETSGDDYQQADPLEQARQLMSNMPYGTPGDRQKRASIVAQARTLIGIGDAQQSRMNDERQYGLDMFNAYNPSTVSQIGRYKSVDAVPPSYDDQGNFVPGRSGYILDSSYGTTTSDDQAQGSGIQEYPNEGQYDNVEFKSPEEISQLYSDNKISRTKARSLLETKFPDLALDD